jgi:hypothetical protein
MSSGETRGLLRMPASGLDTARVAMNETMLRTRSNGIETSSRRTTYAITVGTTGRWGWPVAVGSDGSSCSRPDHPSRYQSNMFEKPP